MLGLLIKIKDTLIDFLQAIAILLQNPKSILIISFENIIFVEGQSIVAKCTSQCDETMKQQ